jgi:uncharacterized membrane protein YphA (DoxX/SURF4 family)
MNDQRIKTIAYWVTTILGPASFVIGGCLYLTHSEQVVTALNHLGYPIYFANILGFWKLAGAIAIVIPGFPLLKEWAYAGFFFDLSGGAASHAFNGDPFFVGPASVALPMVFLGLVIASWALRPPSRRLPGT